MARQPISTFHLPEIAIQSKMGFYTLHDGVVWKLFFALFFFSLCLISTNITGIIDLIGCVQKRTVVFSSMPIVFLTLAEVVIEYIFVSAISNAKVSLPMR